MTPFETVQDAIQSSVGYRRRWDLQASNSTEYAELCQLLSELSEGSEVHSRYAEYWGTSIDGKPWHILVKP